MGLPANARAETSALATPSTALVPATSTDLVLVVAPQTSDETASTPTTTAPEPMPESAETLVPPVAEAAVPEPTRVPAGSYTVITDLNTYQGLATFDQCMDHCRQRRYAVVDTEAAADTRVGCGVPELCLVQVSAGDAGLQVVVMSSNVIFDIVCCC